MGTLFTLIFFIILIGQILGKFSELMRQISSTSGQTYRRTRSRKQFTIDDAKFVVQMLAKVARANGRVNEEEARYISRMLDMICSELGSFDYRDRLKAFYNNAKIDDTAIFDIAAEYRMKRNLSQKECISIVIYLLNLAYIDGNFDYHEKAAIEDACKGFGIYGTISDQLFAKFEREFGAENDDFTDSCENEIYLKKGAFDAKNQEKDPYEILGVSKEANFDEIKKAYKAITMKFAYQAAANSAKSSLPTDN